MVKSWLIFKRLQIIVNYPLLIKASDKCKYICICNVLNENINKVATVIREWCVLFYYKPVPAAAVGL